jgi:hypothetical protein
MIELDPRLFFAFILLLCESIGALAAWFCCRTVHETIRREVESREISLRQEIDHLNSRLHRRIEVLQNVERHLADLVSDGAAWAIHRTAYKELVDRFNSRVRAVRASPQSNRTIATRVQHSLDSIRVDQSIVLKSDVEAFPRSTEPAAINHWRETYAPPMDLEDVFCRWEYVHLPTSAKLIVKHARHEGLAHWILTARLVTPDHLDDDGRISAIEFEQHALSVHKLISYEDVPLRCCHVACSLAQLWVATLLIGNGNSSPATSAVTE